LAGAPVTQQSGKLRCRDGATRTFHRSRIERLAIDFKARNVMIRGMVRRLVQLYAGLVLYGLSMALMYEATLGLDSWDVFHQGLAERTGISCGRMTMIVRPAGPLAAIPLRPSRGPATPRPRRA